MIRTHRKLCPQHLVFLRRFLPNQLPGRVRWRATCWTSMRNQLRTSRSLVAQRSQFGDGKIAKDECKWLRIMGFWWSFQHFQTNPFGIIRHHALFRWRSVWSTHPTFCGSGVSRDAIWSSYPRVCPANLAWRATIFLRCDRRCKGWDDSMAREKTWKRRKNM